MADFVITQENVNIFPAFVKNISLAAGDCLTDDADLVAWCAKTVAAGKAAELSVTIVMNSYEDV